MSIAEIRRARLRELASRYASQAAFARASWQSDAYISQILTGNRNMGEKVARKIERVLQLADGFLDTPPGAPRSLEMLISTEAQVVSAPEVGGRKLTHVQQAIFDAMADLSPEEEEQIFAAFNAAIVPILRSRIERMKSEPVRAVSAQSETSETESEL